MALKQAADFEQTQVSFEVLTGSVENGKALIQDLTSFAAKTPFTFTGITDAAKQLMAYGVAQKDIIPTASMLGDIAM